MPLVRLMMLAAIDHALPYFFLISEVARTPFSVRVFRRPNSTTGDTKIISTTLASFNRLAGNATDDVESGAFDLDSVLRFARRSGRHRHSNFQHTVLVGRLNL